jgi:hypothetical protein
VLRWQVEASRPDLEAAIILYNTALIQLAAAVWFLYSTVPVLCYVMYVSGFDQVSIPQLFYKCFYNHAYRPRLEKLLHLELSRTFNGFF